MSRHVALLCLFGVALALLPGAALAQSAPQLSVSAGISGELSTIVCAHPPQAALVRVARELAAARPALALDAGGLLGASATVTRAGTEQPEQVAAALDAMGLKALVFGRADLSAPRGSHAMVARALAARGIPYVLSNLRCTNATGRQLCDLVQDSEDPPVLLSVAGERVGLVAALPPTALTTVARDRSEGLALEEPQAATRRAVAAARAAGATRVLVVYQPQRGNELADASAFTNALTGDGMPDLVLLNNTEQLFLEQRTRAGLRVLSTRRGHALTLPLSFAGEAATPAQEREPEAVQRLVSSLREWFCQNAGAPLEGAGLERPLPISEFIDLTLDVMREESHGEVAVINRRAFDDARQFPVVQRVTRLAVNAALPFDNQLRVARVPGAALRTILTRLLRNNDLAVRGASLDGTTVKVNGRAIDDTLSYLLVTTDYIAEGGDGGLGEGSSALSFSPVGTEDLRGVMTRWLGRPRPGDLRASVLDPARRTRWSFRATADLSFSAALINNPQNMLLTDAQLARAQTLVLRGDLEVRADADHPDYTWENSVRLRYGAVNTLSDPAGTPQTMGFQPNADLIAARSTASFRGYQRGGARPWLPQPYGEFFLESEFNPPPTRNYRHLLLRPMVGARWTVFQRLSFYLGTGLETEALAPAPTDPRAPAETSRVAWSLVAGWTLPATRLFSLAGRNVELETNGELTVRDLVWRTQLLARGMARLSVPLLDILSLTVSWDVFLHYARFAPTMAGGAPVEALGVSNDLVLGLRLVFARSLQGFSL